VLLARAINPELGDVPELTPEQKEF